MDGRLAGTLPTKHVTKRRPLDAEDKITVKTPTVLARRQQGEVYCVLVEEEPVMWIPEGTRRPSTCLMIGAHMVESRHRGVRTTLARLRPH